MDGEEINKESKCKCCLCFKSSNCNPNSQKRISGIVHDIYNSCMKYINSDYLTEPEFAHWCQPNPLPFCKNCMRSTFKLNQMNQKLEKIQNQIDQLINSFTAEFLKSRENPNNNFCSEDDSEEEFPFSNNLNLKADLEELLPIKQERNDSPEFFEELSPFGAHSQDSNDEMHLPSVEMKIEVNNEKKFRRGRKKKKKLTKKPVSKTKKERATINLRRVKFDADGNLVPNDDLLPRRKAAVKAEETFIAGTDDLEDLSETDQKQDNVSDSEESISDEYNSSVEEDEKRSSRKSKKKRSVASAKPSSKKRQKGIKQFQCFQCHKFYTTKHHLREHTLTHDKSNRFKCTICDNVSFAYVRNLRQHMFKHKHNLIVDKEFKCQKCDSTFKTSSLLREHKKEAHKDMIYECSVCGVSYTFLKSLQQHSLEIHKLHLTYEGEKLSVTNEKPEMDILRFCNICNKQYKNKETLKSHKRKSHGPIQKHYCMQCNKEFKTSSGLKEHMDRHNRDPNDKVASKKFTCNICEKVLSSRGSLNLHILGHSQVKRFECTFKCGKWFATKSNLNDHLIYHKGERAFLCEECGKSFFTKGKLKNHTRIHTGLLHFCEFCGKGFQTTTHLKQHHRSHNKKSDDNINVPVAPPPQLVPASTELQLPLIEGFKMPETQEFHLPMPLNDEFKLFH